MDTFRAFTPTHAAVIAAFVAITGALVLARRRLGDDGKRAALDRSLGLITAGIYVIVNAWPLLPKHFSLAWSLPLHVCDVTTLAVPLALLTNSRRARAVVYFWGLGLSTQGFITPDLRDGPARIGFWMVWLAHFSVVGGAVYEVVARGYRPTWRDYGFAVAAGLVYVAVVLPLDVLLGVNYGYVGPAMPGQPSIVDALGPWPYRVGVMIVLAGIATALLMLPWDLAARYRQRHLRPATLPVGAAGDR